jgi:hypothetical protein
VTNCAEGVSRQGGAGPQEQLLYEVTAASLQRRQAIATEFKLARYAEFEQSRRPTKRPAGDFTLHHEQLGSFGLRHEIVLNSPVVMVDNYDANFSRG